MPMGSLSSAHAVSPSTTSTTHLIFVPNNKHKRISVTSESALVATAYTMASSTLATSSNSRSTSLFAIFDCVVKFLRGFAFSTWTIAPLINTDNLQGTILKHSKYLKTFEFEQPEDFDVKCSFQKFTTTTTRLTVQLQYAEKQLLHSSAELQTSLIMPTFDLTNKMNTSALLHSNKNNDNTLESSLLTVVFSNSEPISVHFRPTFCYFVIDCHSVALQTRKKRISKCAQKTTWENEENILQCISYTQQKRLSHSCNYDEDHTDEDEIEDDEDNDRNNNSWHDTSLSSLQERQRYLSDCSDDFICFADDNENYDNNDVNHLIRPRLLEWQVDNKEGEDNDDDEEDDAAEFKRLGYLKKVRFDLKPKVYIMRTWDFAYRSARKGHWEDYARDRTRFRRRIETTGVYLDPILNSEHRSKIYENRFADKKNVRFDLKPKVYIMRTWDFAYRSARKGHWEDYARDRTRFRRRIETTGVYLDPILNSEHRSKIYENRFADKKNVIVELCT